MRRVIPLLLPGLMLISFTCFGAARYFPQIADGEVGAVRFKTAFFFVNTGQATTVNLAFRNDSGSPLEMTLTSLGSGSDFEIPLPEGGAVSLETPGTGELKVGYAGFESSPQVGGTAVFTGIDSGTDTVLYEAGVAAVVPLSRFSIFVDSLGDRNTGLALLAPASEMADSEPGERLVQLRLYDLDHAEVSGTTLPLVEGAKIARFVHELFPEVAAAAREMQGTVQVESETGTLAAVTLRQVQPRQPFPEKVPTLTTFPVVSAPEPGWSLVWSDEFSGSSLDLEKWEFQLGNGTQYGLPIGWGNNEMQYYTDRPENVTVREGRLVITARRESFQTWSYTSGRIRTLGKGDWKYGRFEIRAKLPTGKGIWPAIWMLPSEQVYGTWAASGEIDIMEMVGHEPGTIHGTLHYGAQWPNNASSSASYTLESGDFSDDFHTFALEWEDGEIRWYVDDVLFSTRSEWFSQDHPFPAPFDQEFHLLINLAVGGNWPGPPNSTTEFPQTLEVDYVRIYSR